MYVKAAPVTEFPITMADVTPCMSMLKAYVKTAANGNVTSQLPIIATLVARRYLPCPPTNAQLTVPAVIAILPMPRRGRTSTIRR
jgi:hypothetical protein